jgi:hypothetical protein
MAAIAGMWQSKCQRTGESAVTPSCLIALTCRLQMEHAWLAAPKTSCMRLDNSSADSMHSRHAGGCGSHCLTAMSNEELRGAYVA